MKTDFADIYVYAIIASVFFFVFGSIIDNIVVAIIGLLLVIGLLGILILFALKDFGWFEKPTIVYVDRPVDTPHNTMTEREIIHHHHPTPDGVYQEEYEDEYDIGEDPDYYDEPESHEPEPYEPDWDFHLGTLVTGGKKKKDEDDF